VDDWRKVVNKDPEGMPSREKYLWQSVIGLLAALYLVFCISENSNARVFELFAQWIRSGFDVNLPPKAGLLVPFFKEVSYPLGVLGFVVLTYLVIVGSSNAVNVVKATLNALEQLRPQSEIFRVRGITRPAAAGVN